MIKYFSADVPDHIPFPCLKLSYRHGGFINKDIELSLTEVKPLSREAVTNILFEMDRDSDASVREAADRILELCPVVKTPTLSREAIFKILSNRTSLGCGTINLVCDDILSLCPTAVEKPYCSNCVVLREINSVKKYVNHSLHKKQDKDVPVLSCLPEWKCHDNHVIVELLNAIIEAGYKDGWCRKEKY